MHLKSLACIRFWIMITKEIAYNLIFERGLHLPVDKEYESKRLKEIAVRRNELFAELTELDKEIIDMNGK